MPKLPINRQRAMGYQPPPSHARRICVVGTCTYDLDGVCDFEELNFGAVDALDFIDPGGMSSKCRKIRDEE